MKKRDLIILTYSELKNFGGGIESWLQKFLSPKNISKLNSLYNKITVIGLESDRNNLLCESLNNKILDFTFVSSIRFKPVKRLLRFIKETNRLIKKLTRSDDIFDLLCIGTLYPSLPLLFIKKKKNMKSIIWLRSVFPYEIQLHKIKYIRPVIILIESKCLKKADMIISNGSDTTNYYKSHYNCKDIITINNAIEVSKIKPNNHFFENDNIKIAFIGRYYENKGIYEFIESIKLYNLRHPNSNLKFIFIGFGEAEKEVNELVSKYNNVTNLGYLPNQKIYDILQEIDVNMNLTKSLGGGGVSNSLLEGIFSNNLIIAWDSIIYKQVLTDEMGIFIEENNINELVIAYEKLNNRSEMVAKIVNMEKIKNNYTFDEHIKQFCKSVNNLYHG